MSHPHETNTIPVKELPPVLALGTAIKDGRKLVLGILLGGSTPVVIDHAAGTAFVGCWCDLVEQAIKAMPAPSQEAPTCH